MNNFDEIQELVWDLSGDVDYVLDYLSKVYPGVSVMIVTKDPINLPPNVVACCGSGSGEVEPVSRWELTKAVSKRNGEVLNIDIEQIWTSPAAKWNDPSGWDLFFWDNETDDEVFLK